jgi:STE24 endopeptidase
VAAPFEARLFRRVAELEDGALRSRLERLADRQGTPLRAIRVVEVGRSTRSMGAYVAGEGPSRELVLTDTLLEAVGPDEVEIAVAHELYHEARRKPAWGHVLSGLALVALLAFIAAVLRLAARPLGLSGPGDIRGLPLVVLVASLVFLAARPVELARSRAEEARADRAALVATSDPEAWIRLQVALTRASRTEVRPPGWARWLQSHPSPSERIGTALWYRSWLAGHGPADGSPLPGRAPEPSAPVGH